jgi:hypothetical protein
MFEEPCLQLESKAPADIYVNVLPSYGANLMCLFKMTFVSSFPLTHMNELSLNNQFDVRT